MSNTLHNIIIGAVALVLIGLGYFLFMRPSDTVLDAGLVNPMAEQVLLKTQAFIQYRMQLDQVSLPMDVFTDARFTSLRSYTPPFEAQVVGTTDLFTTTDTVPGDTGTATAQ